MKFAHLPFRGVSFQLVTAYEETLQPFADALLCAGDVVVVDGIKLAGIRWAVVQPDTETQS